jgi:hypothetical protein
MLRSSGEGEHYGQKCSGSRKWDVGVHLVGGRCRINKGRELLGSGKRQLIVNQPVQQEAFQFVRRPVRSDSRL